MKVTLSLVMLVLLLSLTGVAISCGKGASEGAAAGASASIDSDHIYRSPFFDYVIVVPVIVTPTGVPTADVTYWVQLLSREGYSYGTQWASWAEGSAPTPQTVDFTMGDNEQSASHVYLHLDSDLKSNDLDALRADASSLLRVEISSTPPPLS